MNSDEGIISIVDERYMLFRGASLSINFYKSIKDIFSSAFSDEECDDFIVNFMFNLAYGIGTLSLLVPLLFKPNDRMIFISFCLPTFSDVVSFIHFSS